MVVNPLNSPTQRGCRTSIPGVIQNSTGQDSTQPYLSWPCPLRSRKIMRGKSRALEN